MLDQISNRKIMSESSPIHGSHYYCSVDDMYVSSSRVRKTLFLILIKLFLVLCSKLVACGKDLSPVVYRADKAIQWISHYLT